MNKMYAYRLTTPSRYLWRGILAATLIVSVVAPRVQAANVPAGLRTVGNQVVTSSGQSFIPEGISVYGGLEDRNYNRYKAATYAQIQAAATYWHVNTIRLQVAESNLFAGTGARQPFNRRFLDEIDHQVQYAHNLGLAVVINDQTEFTNLTEAPTTQTDNFWNIIAKKYRSQPYVIFDLFNEPRLTTYPYTSELSAGVGYNPVVQSQLETYHMQPKRIDRGQVWKLWQNGGMLQGTKYVGMQTLVNTVRRQNANNLVWVEGPYGARQLPSTHYLLQGTGIAYAIHHPNLNNPASWKSIAKLASQKPVVEGEWAQYESTWPECYSRAYLNAPKYINFLHSQGIGIIAWSLQPNSLLQGSEKLGQPTNLETDRSSRLASALATPNKMRPDYACDDYGEGVGSLLQHYFSQNSTRYTL